jgi:hypothetical protein
MSPSPVAPLPWIGVGISGVPVICPGVSMSGMMMRLTKFHSPKVTGNTGWTFRKLASPLSAP